jgi:glycine C-acetyltransferase
MRTAGFDVAGPEHPIVPIMIGDAAAAQQMAAGLLDRGIYAIGFSYPVVPRGAARIRTQISAAHTKEDLERAVAAFAKCRMA